MSAEAADEHECECKRGHWHLSSYVVSIGAELRFNDWHGPVISSAGCTRHAE